MINHISLLKYKIGNILEAKSIGTLEFRNVKRLLTSISLLSHIYIINISAEVLIAAVSYLSEQCVQHIDLIESLLTARVQQTRITLNLFGRTFLNVVYLNINGSEVYIITPLVYTFLPIRYGWNVV